MDVRVYIRMGWVWGLIVVRSLAISCSEETVENRYTSELLTPPPKRATITQSIHPTMEAIERHTSYGRGGSGNMSTYPHHPLTPSRQGYFTNNYLHQGESQK
jgi:hypothetical protein